MEHDAIDAIYNILRTMADNAKAEAPELKTTEFLTTILSLALVELAASEHTATAARVAARTIVGQFGADPTIVAAVTRFAANKEVPN